jgi:hypothetical protein
MTFEMILPFDSDDESFIRGFEAGRIWVLMEENPYKLTGLIFHAVNAEMIMRMIEVRDLKLTVEFTDDETWMRFRDD